MLRRPFLAVALLTAASVHSDEIHIAVAANFASPMQKIAAEFEKESGHTIVASFASTGKLYAQIKAGAPFEVLLAADDETPARLEKEGDGVVGSRFTYAVGRLVLWSRREGFVDDRGEVLRRNDFQHLALPNPRLAPYGAAGIQTLQALALLDRLQLKFVTAENISQAYQFVASGNAELGFVALSQVYRQGRIAAGSGWIVPPQLHDPIRQDALLLARGKGSPGPAALLTYLRGDKARSIIRSFGYEL
ncbi:molybdate ABC transporter substrate-binding protein [Accumulibacter sp.]|uniref:molybdate ABC transporter substrate-binding protein n=1 Tax=Accumulibacter sp. TaxID=2053492 RepID=UPI0025E26E23|nr:molybdate ABC transporter substrate-binding protein [Accumulibacter sp.]MCM8611867.1 molybdate ABC transporter substrate-binding protein [Accumulibacter sp.]MCM8635489.1 molybdate ABC transporter substrate-binding protein [Accumulibacter sp.]MCM8639067.1 molybdate ABC transporter substrate-binding protein [Accumulibacter sp.]